MNSISILICPEGRIVCSYNRWGISLIDYFWGEHDAITYTVFVYARIQGVGVTNCRIYNNFDREEVGPNLRINAETIVMTFEKYISAGIRPFLAVISNMKFPTAVRFLFLKGLCDHDNEEEPCNVMNPFWGVYVTRFQFFSLDRQTTDR